MDDSAKLNAGCHQAVMDVASGFLGTPGAKFCFAGTGTSIDTAAFVNISGVKI